MADIIALTVIGLIVAAIVIKLIKDRRAGKRSCGGSCEGCPGCDRCGRTPQNGKTTENDNEAKTGQ